MATRFFSKRNLEFLIHDVFDLLSLTEYDYYKGYNQKSLDMVLKAAIELAEGVLWPHFQEMDRHPPLFEGGEVTVHPAVKTIIEEFGKGGWISATIPEAYGGEQLPHLLADACHFLFSAANYSATAYAGLTTGAAHLIQSFGDRELQETYMPRMLEGEWQGTMALTEPEAGSSLSDITTIAEPTDEDYYRIQGQKIFISAGDYDAVENVIHLMLAKIKGAPAGVKGISLFVVPKRRIEDGRLVPNDVVVSGIFHKLGYRGCPATQLSIGDGNDCRGYLVGAPNHGLKYMFQMMNEARIGVGMGAAAMATAAYYAALEYSRERRQGRPVSAKDPSRPQIPIIEHPDVRRMLLSQRAITEGALSLLLQCSKYVDMEQVSNEEERNSYRLLLEILTPVAKSYPSEMGLVSISQSLQCLGGSGYCDDYPVEQYYRDARIHPIHEGVTAIQGLDLLGRKVVMEDGKAALLYLKVVNETIHEAKGYPDMVPFAEKLAGALEKLQEVTAHLLSLAQTKGVEYFLADATLYLELYGIITIGWQWLMQGIAVQKALEKGPKKSDRHFYEGKRHALRYFFAYELPKISGLAERLMDDDYLTVEMETDWFRD
jgi:butyryl-CoA dehydrogenase